MIFILFQCKKYSLNKKNCLPTDPKKYSDVSGNKTFIFFGLTDAALTCLKCPRGRVAARACGSIYR